MNKEAAVTQPSAEQVRAIIAEFLDRPFEDLGPERRLEEFNIDSFDFIELCFLIEDKTGLEMEKGPSELRASIVTFADIFRLVEEAAARAAAQDSLKNAS